MYACVSYCTTPAFFGPFGYRVSSPPTEPAHRRARVRPLFETATPQQSLSHAGFLYVSNRNIQNSCCGWDSIETLVPQRLLRCCGSNPLARLGEGFIESFRSSDNTEQAHAGSRRDHRAVDAVAANSGSEPWGQCGTRHQSIERSKATHREVV